MTHEIGEKPSGRHHLSASAGDLVGFLSVQLYQHAEIFIRELIANAYDAIVRRGVGNAAHRDGRITISGDKENLVTVEDNGVGMSPDELVHALSCIGGSKTRSARQSGVPVIGRFGLGFLSVLAVAERVVVETRPVGGHQDAASRWLWQGGMAYELMPCRRKQPGTRIEVQLRPEHRRYASPEELERLVQRHAALLDVPIIVSPQGDPRGAVPWRGRPVDTAIRAIEAHSLLPAHARPIHQWTIAFAGGSGALLAFPSTSPNEPQGITLYHRGLRVNEAIQDVLPEDWRWVYGIVDFAEADLTLARDGLRRDQAYQKLQTRLIAAMAEELVFVATYKPDTFARLVAAKRRAITVLLGRHADLRERIGGKFPFYTTVGEISFDDICARARNADGAGELYYLTSSPLSDSRWSSWRAQGRLVLWCQEPEDEQVVRLLVEASTGLKLLRMAFDSQASPAKTVQVPAELATWYSTLQSYLAHEHVLVEPSLLRPPEIPSIAELPIVATRKEEQTIDELDQTLGRFFAALGANTVEEAPQARLLLNLQNDLIRALATQAGSQCSVEVAAALLFASGALRSGLPLPWSWQPVLDRLTGIGLQKLLGSPRPKDTAPHVRCFFAHEFCNDKPLLLALRTVLEHDPYYWEIVSADEQSHAPQLFDDVWLQLAASHVVIGEVSRRNMNVILELGMAYGLQDRPVLLMAERGSEPPFSDLRGHLIFYYDRARDGDRCAGREISEPLRQWLVGQKPLRALRRSLPYLGYRLLVEQDILADEERRRLEGHFPNSEQLLSTSARSIVMATGIPQPKISAAQSYFDDRIRRHRGSAQLMG